MEQNIPTTLSLPTELSPIQTEHGTFTAKPVAANERIKTVDMIRGVALCGILLMNIPGFGFHWSSYYTLIRGSHSGADWWTFETIDVLFEGTMRGLFSMLFGAGMVLFTQNKKEISGTHTITELYYRRLLFLLGFGLINAYVFLWWGDILYFYAFAGMILYPFRKMAAKSLIIIGLVCVGIGMIKNQLQHNDLRNQRIAYLEAVKTEKEGKKLTEKQSADKAAWLQIENWKPNFDDAKDDMAKVRSGYATVWQYYQQRIFSMETWITYNGIWDSLCMMFLGMGLLALGFFSNKLTTSTYLMGMVIGYGIGIPISYFYVHGNIDQSQIAAFVDRYRVSPTILYDVRRTLLAVGHASLVILIFRSKLVPWLMKSLAAVGQMAFTNYLMQSVICTLYFHGYGLGNYNKLSFHQLYYVVAAVWVFQMIASPIWLKYFRFGPFEWAWRSLTYWKKQPFLIS